MARPITLCTAQWADMELEPLCKLAKEMGYEGLEIATWGQLDVHKAAEDPSYVQRVQDTLAKYGLGCWAIAAHVPGQCVADLWDPRLDGFAPAELAGQPDKIRAWGTAELMATAQGRPQPGRQGGHRLHGLPHFQVFLLLPPDQRRDDRRRIPGGSGHLDTHL